LLAGYNSEAQDYTIRGSVSDTLNAASLYRASVVILRSKDSVIESFTHSGPDGRFSLTVPKAGKYIVRITFPSFADYLDPIDVKKVNTDLGEIPMVSKEHLLKEFVLTQQVSAIKIKGDTTEYMADSFKVKEGATVEDLLKKLPGIQVDKNGVITAQGETVQKILVDGEEFFSDDPKVVTKGLQADAVQKVQVYNKKSDQAEFTGIDDGEKTKTINVELKEDKKKGYFGKADAGGGTDGYFQNQAMINAFKAKRQFSAFGIASNTDKVGLGWQDNDKFGSGNGTTMINDDGGVVTTYTSNSDQDFGGWNGQYNGQGLPKTWTGGAHYADKWQEDKNHITANYRYAMQSVELDGNNITENLLPNNKGFTSNQTKTQFSKGDRHGLDFMYDWKIDSNTTLKLTADGGHKQTETKSDYYTNTLTNADVLTNSNTRTIHSNATADYVNADLLFRKKFNKKGRTLSVDAKENYKTSTSDGTLLSGTNIYIIDSNTGQTVVVPTDIHQKKTSDNNTLAFSAKATYTEPISKVAYLEVDYGVTVNNSISKSTSYNFDTATHQFSSSIDSNYSSNYKYNIFSNKGGLNFKFVYKKINFSFGSDVSNAAYLQKNLYLGDSSKTYNYVNLFPKATFNYKLSKQTSINFTYQGNTQQPSISQIQPLRQNTDPLNITLGNTGLKQQFNNTFSLNFNDFKVLTSRYLFGNFSYTTISDAISTRQFSENGLNTTQYINVDGNYYGHGYFGGGMKLRKLDLMVGLHTNASVYHVNNIVATRDAATQKVVDHNNANDNNSYSFGPYFNYDKDNKFNFSLNPSVTYNENKSTISTFGSSYWSFTTEFEGTVQLPKKFEVGTSVDVMMRQKTAVFATNNNVVKWNAYVGKKFLKKSQLELKASVLDILDQNIGFSRTAQAGIITQNSYNTIRRYGMLQLIWNFSHTPAGTPPPSGGMMMMRH
jgi:hypothetical protein